MRPTGDRRHPWIAAVGAATLAATTATLPAQQPGQPPPPRFRADADVVVVEASVLDRKGNVVAGLTPGDFKVEIGGRAREVLSAELFEYDRKGDERREKTPGDSEITTNQPVEQGRQILVIVDQSSLRSQSRGVINAAKEWVMSLGARDRVGLLTYPGTGPRIEPTTDHAKVADLLSRVAVAGADAPMPFNRKNISLWEAFRMNDNDTFIRNEVVARECRGEPLCQDDVDMQAKTMFMDAQAQVQPVLRGLRRVMIDMKSIPGPKHAVLISAGWPTNERDGATEVSWIAADAARANVTIHTFTAESWALAASRSKPNLRPIQDQNLMLWAVEGLAGLTGGRSTRLTGNVALAFEQLDAGLTGYYRLGVRALPEDLDGKEHRITLKVTRPGATVSAHRRVLAGTPGPPPAAVDPETALRDALKGGPAQTGMDLRITSYVLHGAGGSRDLRVVAVGDVARAAPGMATAVAALYELDGKPATAMEKQIEVPAGAPGAMSIELSAPPGTYVLRVAVRDAEGRIGSLERFVDAQWRKVGGVETPGLVLFRSAGGAGAPPRPVLDQVTTDDQVIAQLALAAPPPDDRTQVVFDVAPTGNPGAPLMQRAARIAQTTAGATVAQESWPASLLPPGRYTLRAAVRPGEAAPFTRTFTVAPAATAPAAVVAVDVPRFSTATVLDPDFVGPALERLAARPDTVAVRDALQRIRTGAWTIDGAAGPLSASPVASHFVGGLARLQRGALDDAARAFRATLQAAPDFGPALTYLGACYAAGGKDKEAAGAWQMALVRDRASPLLQRLAIEAWLRAGNVAAAQAQAAQARERWPDDDLFVGLQAQAAIAGGRLQEGLQLVSAMKQPDATTLLLAMNTLYESSRRKTPVWDAARDLETLRTLREPYAALKGESLGLVDAWIAEMARGGKS